LNNLANNLAALDAPHLRDFVRAIVARRHGRDEPELPDSLRNTSRIWG
jgi:hypothetical protein